MHRTFYVEAPSGAMLSNMINSRIEDVESRGWMIVNVQYVAIQTGEKTTFTALIVYNTKA